MRKSLWIVLAIVLAAVAAPHAQADTVTLDVSGSLKAELGTAACSSSGCTLGGEIVINNTTGAIISEDVTMSGESPTVGPFTTGIGGIEDLGGLTVLFIEDPGGHQVGLFFSTPAAGFLIGYNGGPLSPSSAVFGGVAMWDLQSGALTPAVTPATEPSSVALMLLGVGLLFVMRKRIGEGVPQAS